MNRLQARSQRLALGTLLGLSAIASALAVPGATFATTPVATTAVTTASCEEGRWPASAQGQPLSFKAGARAGDYLWHNPTGWHLRFTHPGTGRVVFTGRVVSDTPLTVAPFRLESGDSFALSVDRKTLTYRFLNHGWIDGLDLRTACATRLWFRGSMAGVRLPVGRIWIGHAGRHPLQNPFVILRNR